MGTRFSPRDLIDESITEEQWQHKVCDYATLCGWWWWHDNDPRRNNAGWPDLILVRHRVLFVELKKEKGRVSAAQTLVMTKLVQAGAEVYVWRPSDWPEVYATLERPPMGQSPKLLPIGRSGPFDPEP